MKWGYRWRVALPVRDSRFLPEVTKENPWVSMATPVLWTCSSMYQLMNEDFPAEWLPEKSIFYTTSRL